MNEPLRCVQRETQAELFLSERCFDKGPRFSLWRNKCFLFYILGNVDVLHIIKPQKAGMLLVLDLLTPPVLLPLLCWPLAGCASYLRNVLHQPRRGLRAAPSWRGQVPRREAWLHYSPLCNFICRLFLSKAQIDLSAPVKTVFVWFPVGRGASLETGFLNLSVVDYYENKDYDLCLSHLDIFAGQLE